MKFFPCLSARLQVIEKKIRLIHLQAANQPAEAESLSSLAVQILFTSLGWDHTNSHKLKGGYLKILQDLVMPGLEIQVKLDALDRLCRA